MESFRKFQKVLFRVYVLGYKRSNLKQQIDRQYVGMIDHVLGDDDDGDDWEESVVTFQWCSACHG
jgi:hypothetical protein